MSTLVFHHGALGDSVLIWPLLRGMKDVVLVAQWGKAKLAECWLPHVRAVDGDSPDFARLFVPGGECEAGEGVNKLLLSAERVIGFVSNGRDAWARNVKAMAGGPVYFVPSRPPEGGGEHVTRFHARKTAEQNVRLEPVMPAHRRNPDGPVVIHPGSGGKHKRWPAERFDALLDHLHSLGRPAQIVIGEVEREQLDSLWIEGWKKEYEVVEPADFIELSRVLSRAAVFIGNDSGPTQLAAQLGVNTLSLFGPTDPRVWSPVGPAVRVLHPPLPAPMDWLDVAPVAEAIARFG